MRQGREGQSDHARGPRPASADRPRESAFPLRRFSLSPPSVRLVQAGEGAAGEDDGEAAPAAAAAGPGPGSAATAVEARQRAAEAAARAAAVSSAGGYVLVDLEPSGPRSVDVAGGIGVSSGREDSKLTLWASDEAPAYRRTVTCTSHRITCLWIVPLTGGAC